MKSKLEIYEKKDKYIPFYNSLASHHIFKHLSQYNILHENSTNKRKFMTYNELKELAVKILRNSNNPYYFNCNLCGKELYLSPKEIIFEFKWCKCFRKRAECFFFENIYPIFPELIWDYYPKWSLISNIPTSTTNKINKLNKLDILIDDVLIKDKYQILNLGEKRKDIVKRRRRKQFDFVLKEEKVIIEVDGIEHIRKIIGWYKSGQDVIMNDIAKMKSANKNGYHVIRIMNKDIWIQYYDWILLITRIIQNLESNNEILNIFICRYDEYKPFCFDENCIIIDPFTFLSAY